MRNDSLNINLQHKFFIRFSIFCLLLFGLKYEKEQINEHQMKGFLQEKLISG